MSNVTHSYVLEKEANYWRTEANHVINQWMKTLDELDKYRWQPIATAPLNELVICLWAHNTIGTQIFYGPGDLKTTYAKYWIPIPPLPNGLNS
jgi:hypothetical protein